MTRRGIFTYIIENHHYRQSVTNMALVENDVFVVDTFDNSKCTSVDKEIMQGSDTVIKSRRII